MPRRFAGSIFDVDGVLVDSPHETAWRESLRELMDTAWSGIRDHTSWSPDAFTSHVYQELVAGKPRMDGATAVLEHFRVPEARGRAGGYAERKQAMVVRLIEAGDFTAYPDALRFAVAVKDAGIAVAAASSSKNARLLLGSIRLDTGLTLLDLFDVDVSGRDFAHGKPDPEMFLVAARELGVAPEACLVVEDAPAGIEAARTGGMAAIGVARAHDAGLLAAAGADIVVATLDEVDVGALAEGRLAVRRRQGPAGLRQ